MPPVPLVLSPYPPTNPPTPLPPPSALPRLVKQLPPGFTDSQLYDVFRPFGALASANTHTPLGPDVAIIEFWNEEDAIQAEEAMHCAEVEGQNISVQIYQPARRPMTSLPEFNVGAPSFVPSGLTYSPYSAPQVSPFESHCNTMTDCNSIVFSSSCKPLLAYSVTCPGSFAIHTWTRPASPTGSFKRSWFK